MVDNRVVNLTLIEYLWQYYRNIEKEEEEEARKEAF